MGLLKIIRVTNKDERFYPWLGPFLSRREIVSELGSPVWDDDGKEWFIARRGRKVVGFAALRTVGKHVSLVSAYVRPEARGAGVYQALVQARIEALDRSRPTKAVATAAAVTALRHAGFRDVGTRGSYTLMELP